MQLNLAIRYDSSTAVCELGSKEYLLAANETLLPSQILNVHVDVNAPGESLNSTYNLITELRLSSDQQVTSYTLLSPLRNCCKKLPKSPCLSILAQSCHEFLHGNVKINCVIVKKKQTMRLALKMLTSSGASLDPA